MTGTRAPVAERIVRRVVPDGDCWVWTGARSGTYGRIYVAGRSRIAHRVSYETFVGPIPEGLQIDHLCRNRLCLAPAHLEPVPQQVNLARGESPWAINARKTHCKRGHEFTPENTIVSRKGERNCRICRTAYLAAWRARRSA